jgi:hypothetical protein
MPRKPNGRPRGGTRRPSSGDIARNHRALDAARAYLDNHTMLRRLAYMHDVSEQSIKCAARVICTRPDLVVAIKNGALTARSAYDVACAERRAA